MNAKNVKRTIRKNVKIAQKKGDEFEKIAMEEYAKLKKQMDVATKKVGGYVKKNPKKAALIAAGIGAAIGAAISGAIVAASKKKKR
jgi:ElaB/YqjD/DUF883 family membrane-anchored ribosome-binding protein